MDKNYYSKHKAMLHELLFDEEQKKVIETDEKSIHKCHFDYLSAKLTVLKNVLGNILVGISLILASYLNKKLLLISILILLVITFDNLLKNNQPSFQIINKDKSSYIIVFILNSVSQIFIIFSFMLYVGSPFFLLGLLLLILYSWSLITYLLHKVFNVSSYHYSILNADQYRLLITLMIITELIIPWSLIYSVFFLMAMLAVSNIKNIYSLLFINKD